MVILTVLDEKINGKTADCTKKQEKCDILLNKNCKSIFKDELTVILKSSILN